MPSDDPAAETDALSAGWEQISSLLDAIGVRTYTVDRDLLLIHADGPLDPFTGLDSGSASPHRPLGEPFLDLLPESERTRWERIAHGVMTDSTGEPANLAVIRMIASGERARRRLAQIVARRFGDTGESEGVLFVSREIPEWLVRSAPDENGPGKDAGRLDLARQFAATLNHEINNPLFVVSATLEDLLADEQDPDARKRLQIALDSTWKVAEAVKQFQELKRIVSVSYIPGYTMIDLNASSEG